MKKKKKLTLDKITIGQMSKLESSNIIGGNDPDESSKIVVSTQCLGQTTRSGGGGPVTIPPTPKYTTVQTITCLPTSPASSSTTKAS